MARALWYAASVTSPRRILPPPEIAPDPAQCPLVATVSIDYIVGTGHREFVSGLHFERRRAEPAASATRSADCRSEARMAYNSCEAVGNKRPIRGGKYGTLVTRFAMGIGGVLIIGTASIRANLNPRPVRRAAIPPTATITTPGYPGRLPIQTAGWDCQVARRVHLLPAR